MTKHLSLWVTAIGFMGTSLCWAAAERIDLAEFGRVVHFPEVPTRVTTTQDGLTRGGEGWDAVRDEDGQYSIGVEWDAPLLISEVTIEFRHAIANRELIKAQYWEEAPAAKEPGKADKTDKSERARGRWLTPKAEWWAGDRDVSFAFLKDDQESTSRRGVAETHRRTTRLRFVCGKQVLPPVRYLRAYGPGKVATDTFDIRFDKKSPLTLPVTVDPTNGFIMAADGKTTLDSSTIRETPASIVVRYFRDDRSSPNRTLVALSPVDKPEQQYTFLPTEVAHASPVRIASAGLVIERRGSKLPATREAESSTVRPPSSRPG